MKVNKISLFLLVACLFSVACGSAASYTRRYNPNAKSPLLDLSLEKRLELAKKYLKVDYYESNPYIEVLDSETGKWGLIDAGGVEVLPCIYDCIFDFHEGYASVELDGKCGLIDEDAKVVVPCKYDYSLSFNDGLATVCLNGKWGAVNGEGKEIIACVYNTELFFSDGMALAGSLETGKYGYIDMQGKEVVPFKYDYAGPIIDGVACVAIVDGETERVGVIDREGDEVVPCGRYNWIGNFLYGLAEVKLNGKCGFVDKSGKEVVPCIYDDGRAVSEYI